MNSRWGWVVGVSGTGLGEEMDKKTSITSRLSPAPAYADLAATWITSLGCSLEQAVVQLQNRTRPLLQGLASA